MNEYAARRAVSLRPVAAICWRAAKPGCPAKGSGRSVAQRHSVIGGKLSTPMAKNGLQNRTSGPTIQAMEARTARPVARKEA
jgi:hypothetical protein